MLMIICETDTTGAIRLDLHGRFTSEYVPEIERTLTANGGAERAVALNLANVTFVDRPAMEFLRIIRSQGIKIKHLPSYVARWIKQEASNDLSDENGDTSQMATTMRTIVSRRSR